MNQIKITKLQVLIPLLLMFIISIISLYTSSLILPDYYGNILIKQIIWYLLGFYIIHLIQKINLKFIYKKISIIYIIGNIVLLSLLLFTSPINNSKCWFNIPYIGTIQPSEFMKIILIFTLSSNINKYNKLQNKTLKNEILFLLKIFIITLIPSILTFLEPDTGVVIIYVIITIVMLFIGGVRYRWFLILIASLVLLISIILYLYFNKIDLFINIFGSSLFLRINRLLDWSNKTGYQLNNSLITIGASGLLGFGLFNIPIYYPESHTDFVFTTYVSNFGFIGSLFLIVLITYFDLKLLKIALKSKKRIDKYTISGIIGMFTYEQIQNIGMTYGVLPITGITLPFISYGGSSIITNMIVVGLILNIINKRLKKDDNHLSSHSLFILK